MVLQRHAERSGERKMEGFGDGGSWQKLLVCGVCVCVSFASGGHCVLTT